MAAGKPVPKVDHAFCQTCGQEFFLDNSKSICFDNFKSIYFCNTKCACDYALGFDKRFQVELDAGRVPESGAVLNDWKVDNG